MNQFIEIKKSVLSLQLEIIALEEQKEALVKNQKYESAADINILIKQKRAVIESAVEKLKTIFRNGDLNDFEEKSLFMFLLQFEDTYYDIFQKIKKEEYAKLLEDYAKQKDTALQNFEFTEAERIRELMRGIGK
ncbi:hypothetical protein FCR2A7T_21760 [Flavobacterium cauense R2A-7]|uniref:Uncharacterized protein n=1 Tax=Flavobacterium cauense R2A-7 TaxID=1341154 RepID=V6RWB8_9FLAO|nr:hypothetical protein [Flavobacterium cauense]ESU18773.1 hypothetical protein FCR2A7T_21760 [Flavobacterium cauense R2A-7]KGO81753.1 hypothetical protein Q762_07875 [Flavobacterium cauense R2A-7]TWI13785.1 hypothetical protein IP98_00934 [Flavobacterium cauense R2A-7]